IVRQVVPSQLADSKQSYQQVGFLDSKAGACHDGLDALEQVAAGAEDAGDRVGRLNRTRRLLFFHGVRIDPCRARSMIPFFTKCNTDDSLVAVMTARNLP